MDWQSSWTGDPELFHRWLAKRLSALRLAYAVQDKATFLAALEDMGRFAPAVSADPYLASLEMAQVTATLQVAQLALDGLNWNAAEANLALARRILETKEARLAMRRGEFEPRPESENWYTLLTTVADLAWKQPRGRECRVITYREARAKRDLVVANIAAHLELYPRAEGWASTAIEQGLAWCDTKLCAWAWRVHPEEYAEMRDAADRRAPRLLSDRERPYYWDLALALAWASNEVSAKELKNNSAMRRVMLRKECGGGMPLAGYDRAARAELDYLLSNATLRLAVMAGD